MYTTIDSQNAKLISALGEACSVTEQLPTPAVLSTELKKCEDIAVASGGLTDIWRGEFSGLQVAIKAFRISAAENLRQAKKVRLRYLSPGNSRPRTSTCTDSVATGADMEEAVPRKHPTIPWCKHDAFSTWAHIRLGEKPQH